jgi:hypothetical protein
MLCNCSPFISSICISIYIPFWINTVLFLRYLIHTLQRIEVLTLNIHISHLVLLLQALQVLYELIIIVELINLFLSGLILGFKELPIDFTGLQFW